MKGDGTNPVIGILVCVWGIWVWVKEHVVLS